MKSSALEFRVIASYLPQFHPIPENDAWWGKGFTEWTNVGKAKPLFRGHDQPKVPSELGYYDLRVPETRRAQADLAREHGIEGFCYWHYWLGNGRRLLERPFEEVLASGEPDFPFCLAWANHSWRDNLFSGGGSDRILVPQLYPGPEDHVRHFQCVLPAFRDPRYITVDGKPVFLVFDPRAIPDVERFLEDWRQLARDAGLSGIHFVGQTHGENQVAHCRGLGFDAVNPVRLHRFQRRRSKPRRLLARIERVAFDRGQVVDYRSICDSFVGDEERAEDCYPTVIPNWDPSPRKGRRANIFVDATPLAFRQHVEHALAAVQHKAAQHRIVFVKSWNEWGEGNYLEPDLRYGRGHLESLKAALVEASDRLESGAC